MRVSRERVEYACIPLQVNANIDYKNYYASILLLKINANGRHRMAAIGTAGACGQLFLENPELF
jgi:hypothetical protein